MLLGEQKHTDVLLSPVEKFALGRCACGNHYNKWLAVQFDILITSRGCQGYTLD